MGSFAKPFHGSGSCVKHFNGGCFQSLKEATEGESGIALENTYRPGRGGGGSQGSLVCGGLALLKQLLEPHCDFKDSPSLGRALLFPNRGLFCSEGSRTGQELDRSTGLEH